MSASVREGDPAPDVRVPLHPEGTFSPRDAKGSWLVLYFYPRDLTPGCTTEAGEFQALLPEFERLGAKVVGVSRDPVAKHARFAEKLGLAFPLAADEEGRLCEAFDVIREKNMYGRKVRGIERSTFLIAPDGRIARIWRKVRAKGHAAQVLETLRALPAG